MDDILIGLIKLHEGLRLHMYLDSASPPKSTIGYGRNIQDSGISPDEAELMLQNDIKRCKTEALQLPFFESLDPIRQAVVCDMLFNLGLTRFLKFNRMIKALAMKDYPNAALQMMNSDWAVQVGDRAARLSKMMKTGAL